MAERGHRVGRIGVLLLGAVFALFGVVVASVWLAPVASAHANVVSSSPADGTHLDQSPTALSLELSEPVTLVDGSTQLIDSDGDRYPLAEQRLGDGQRRIIMQPNDSLSDGAYLATARVVSADTHTVSLSIRFTVGAVTENTLTADKPTGVGIDTVLGVASKATVYLGLVLSAGLLLASVWVWPELIGSRRFRRVYRIGAGLLALGLLGRLLVLVGQQSGGLTELSLSAARTVLNAPLGGMILTSIVLSVVCAAAPPGARRTTTVIGFLTAGIGIVTITLGGHGGSTDRWPSALFGTLVHVYATAVWLGGVCVLAFVLGSTTRLEHWHRVAVGHFGLVLGTGLLLTILQVRPLDAVLHTAYGLTLLSKVSLVAGVLVCGYLTFRRGRQQKAQPVDIPLSGAGGVGILSRPVALPVRLPSRARTLTVEVAAGALVLVVTAALSSLVPAKDSYTTNVATRVVFSASEVLDVEIDSVRRGAQTLVIRQSDDSAQASALRPDVSVEFSSVAANVARLPVRLEPVDGAVQWQSIGLIVPAAGQWKVTVRLDAGRGPKLASFFYEVL